MRIHLGMVLLLTLAGCTVQRAEPPSRRVSHSRSVVITAVPLLTREMQAVYPFLRQDFAPGGVLAGKEVYAFVPSTITVLENDTVQLELINPEDDDHDFVLQDLTVRLPGQQITRATWVARRAGIYPFFCTMPAHSPMMWGQMVVLRRSAVGG
jgi:uncharacterized cupredoxin-like copper-binding protein